MINPRDLAIRPKIALLVVITTAGALFLSAAATGIYSRFALEQGSLRELQVISEVLANNTTAALAFSDEVAAQKILDGVAAKRSIVAAMVHRADGTEFVSYVREGFDGEILTGEGGLASFSAQEIVSRYLLQTTPIEVGGRELGRLTIQADYSELNEYFSNTAWILVTIALFSCVAAVLFSFRLQRLLVEPILSLAGVTKQISKEQDFSLRAIKLGGDEIGDLVDSFNHMVSEIEESARALRESEERYQTLADASPVGLLRTDAGGNFTYLNERASEITGVSMNEMDEAGLLSVIHPDDRQEVGALWRETVAKRGTFRGEYRFIQAGGGVSWVLSQARPEFDEQGELLGFLGTLTDLTSRKRVEEEREVLISELEAKNAEMEQFTYTVSHDLKSPLITIRGFLGLLEKDISVRDQKRIESDMEHIESAVHSMTLLLDDLLALSRIGRVMSPPVEFSLAELTRGVVALLSGRIDQRGVEVAVDPELPRVFADRARIEQVMQNLLENGIKFMGDQAKPRIEVSLRREGGRQVIAVRDNGIGIDPAYHLKIFELFDRLSLDIEGTGIGLALVKRIVEVHDGEIWVESEGVGHGTTFCFTLPLAEEWLKNGA